MPLPRYRPGNFALVHKDGLVAVVGQNAQDKGVFSLTREDGAVEVVPTQTLLDDWAPLNKMGEKLLTVIQKQKWGREVKLPFRDHGEEIQALKAASS
jgi:hypothetical protein